MKKTRTIVKESIISFHFYLNRRFHWGGNFSDETYDMWLCSTNEYGKLISFNSLFFGEIEFPSLDMLGHILIEKINGRGR